MAKASGELSGQEFACTKEKKVWEKFEHTHRKSSFPISSTIESLTRPKRRDKRGRPKKDETKERETVYTLNLNIESVPQAFIEEQERCMGYFVLATNHNDASELPAEQVLREYKQQSSVELRFKFLKDTLFVDSLFLKTPERIEALGYVLLIALFIYMTLVTFKKITSQSASLVCVILRRHVHLIARYEVNIPPCLTQTIQGIFD